MSSAHPTDPKKLLTLQETAAKLGVSVETLLEWNDHNILKPTITVQGTIGYTEEQINHFLKFRQLGASSDHQAHTNTSEGSAIQLDTQKSQKTIELSPFFLRK